MKRKNSKKREYRKYGLKIDEIKPADYVFGASPIPFEELVSKSSVQNKNGKISINNKSETNLKGVFAGGDSVNGGKEVVDAVQAGKDGAKGILEF